ncbi:MAG TPA: glycoside hydrolase family 172 protein, partial [Verrucomicrobiae bacterium]|nr:glycoside hydrolase family 172 protein [Verrucomicrobiae bacterium]
GAYYHFVYSTFPAGTQVPTFKRQLSSEESAALDAADKLLTNCGPRSAGEALRKGETLLAVNGNKAVTFPGAGAISLLRVKVDLPPAPADRDPLRELEIQIRWDGEKSASVWSPLGDFFGTAPGVNEYSSYPCGMSPDGWFYANWFMPFAKGAEIKFANRGKVVRHLQYEISGEPLQGDPARYGRFHAKWHRDEFLPTRVDRQIDWPMLITEGSGRYVGVMLHIWNPRGGWWGEGDEKFFVDGEKFPSTFGTGSEDYFGYAWSSPVLFQHALHNQTHNDGSSRGHISVNRWHIADQVPFHTSFEGDIEKYYPNERPTRYASVVYWYLGAGGKDPYMAVPLEDRIGYFAPAPPPARVAGAMEGEELQVLGKTGGTTQKQDLGDFGEKWSNGAQLWWTGAKPGDKLMLEFAVTNSGNYKLRAQFTQAVDYGIVQLSVDGKPLGEPRDFYHDTVIASGEVDLATIELAAGQHEFGVEITGARPKAVKSYLFGLDYLKLVPAETGGK